MSLSALTRFLNIGAFTLFCSKFRTIKSRSDIFVEMKGAEWKGEQCIYYMYVWYQIALPEVLSV